MEDATSTSLVPPAIPGSSARDDAVGAVRTRDREAERAKLKQLAQEFEAMLMNEMLSGWRRSLLTEEGSDGSGMGALTDIAGNEFGRALSRSGGLGLAAVLLRSFERQVGGYDDAAGTTTTIPAAAEARLNASGDRVTAATELGVRAQGGNAPDRAVERPAATVVPEADRLAGAVTSGFGWRADPFTGQARFHSGVDVRMAYGEQVSTIAPGRVSFSGTQGGYGVTVVVDHGDGFQTRYAHLSSVDVQVGDEVSRGQTIARVGTSGRSTGPHLHVELLRGGRAVDPAGLLKAPGGNAD